MKASSVGGLVVFAVLAVAPAARAQSGEQVLFRHPGYETSLRFTMPLWLTESGIDPGFGMEGRFAWEVDAFSPELFMGWQVNQVKVVEVRPGSGNREPLDNFWLGFGGRFYGYNPTAVVPFLGAAVQINFWGATIDSGFIGDELVEERYFDDGSRYVTPSLRAQLGVAFEIGRHFGLEAGVDASLTFEGSVFNDEEVYLSPFVGGTAYF